MKPAPFDYVRPASLDEALALLSADPDARPIAGGQTLVPMMAMRLARPSRLVDIARIDGLRGIREDGDVIAFGAATRQVEAERSPLVAGKLPLLAAALPWVGHPPTRNRGTVGGSIANADPAAEIPLVLTTLAGSVVVHDGKQRTEIKTEDLFLGPMTTALAPGAMVIEARFPVWREARVGVGFHEVSARKSDFAYVSAAAQVALGPDGKCIRATLGIGGATPVPTRLDAVANALAGTALSNADIERAVAGAAGDLEIMHDAHASDAYRRRVATGLAIRALSDARDAAIGKTGGR
ncbi:MAG: xanthine dehydrogenase family protein subunit M [Hyphomicrobiaceae bacterium]